MWNPIYVSLLYIVWKKIALVACATCKIDKAFGISYLFWNIKIWSTNESTRLTLNFLCISIEKHVIIQMHSKKNQNIRNNEEKNDDIQTRKRNNNHSPKIITNQIIR